jgi:hypothetical protein
VCVRAWLLVVRHADRQGRPHALDTLEAAGMPFRCIGVLAVATTEDSVVGGNCFSLEAHPGYFATSAHLLGQRERHALSMIYIKELAARDKPINTVQAKLCSDDKFFHESCRFKAIGSFL